MSRPWYDGGVPSATPAPQQHGGERISPAQRMRWASPATWAVLALLIFMGGSITASVAGLGRPSSQKVCDASKTLNLDGCDLRRASVVGADLHGARLRGSNLDGVDLRRADLRGAHLEGASLQNAWLDRATLVGAWLSGGNLGAAHLVEACLRSAHLEGADLLKADLTGADATAVHTSGVRGFIQPKPPSKPLPACQPR